MRTDTPIALHAALQIIYDAYDRVYDIASHRWKPSAYYHVPSKTSDLMGHYVRSMPEYKKRDPAHITWGEFETASQPLVDAINLLLEAIYPDEVVVYRDISTISRMSTILFKHPAHYDRCMAVFRVIEQAYPRATHRDTAPGTKRRKAAAPRVSPRQPVSYRKPQPTRSWLPYKED